MSLPKTGAMQGTPHDASVRGRSTHLGTFDGRHPGCGVTRRSPDDENGGDGGGIQPGAAEGDEVDDPLIAQLGWDGLAIDEVKIEEPAIAGNCEQPMRIPHRYASKSRCSR